jgi:hypothetical protein
MSEPLQFDLDELQCLLKLIPIMNKMGRMLPLGLAVLSWVLGPSAFAQYSSVSYHYPLAPNYANGATKVISLTPAHLSTVVPEPIVVVGFTGMIRVPPGQERLVIEMPGVQFGDLYSPQVFVARDKQLRLAYGTLGGVVPAYSQYDYGFDKLWDGGGSFGIGGGSYRMVINRPPAGDYYFAPWRYWLFISFPDRGPLSYTVKAEYFPPAPSILRIAPSTQTGNLGGSAAISVTASGQGPLSYSWEKRPLGGTVARVSSALNPSAATSMLTLNNLTLADDAEYRAIVENSGGKATSAWSRVVVRVPPTITAHPQPRSAMPGGLATFNVTASGTAPLTYRWERQDPNGNVVTVPGATSASLTRVNVSQAAHAGSYRVWVMNSAQPTGVASTWAKLTIGPAILGLAPANPSVNEGESVSITASAVGTGPLTYKWYRGAQLRSSGFSDTLNLASTQEADDGAWRLDVQNAAGTASLNFTLDVIPPPTPPTFLFSPANAALTEGETLVLEGRARGTRPISYQWFQSNSLAGGATSATLVISNVGPEHAGPWFVRASNSLGQQDSATATVTVSPGPKFTRQPANTEVAPGSPVTLSVEAVGRAPIGYQWFKNGQPLGVDGPELVMASSSLADSGFYHVVATNGLGNTLASRVARLTVKEGAVPVGSVLWAHEWATPGSINFFPGDFVFITDFGDILVKRQTNVALLSTQGSLLWTYAGAAQQVLSAPGGLALVLFDDTTPNLPSDLSLGSGFRLHALDSRGQRVWQALPPDNEGPPFFGPRSRVGHLGLRNGADLLIAEIHYGRDDIPREVTIPYPYGVSLRSRGIGIDDATTNLYAHYYVGFDSPDELGIGIHRDGSVVMAEKLEQRWNSSHFKAVRLLAENPSGVLSERWMIPHYNSFWCGYGELPPTLGPGGESAYVECRATSRGGDRSRLLNHEGRLVWEVSGGEAVQVWGKSGDLYHASGRLSIRDALTGQIKHQFARPAGSASSGASPALALDGTIYWGLSVSNRATLLAMSQSGLLLWQFTAPTAQKGYSPAIGADGTVYFPTELAVYALKGSAPIMDSSWPCYAGNVRGTFRAQELPVVPLLPSQAIPRGGTLTLNGASGGPQPIRYQWLKDGERIPGATNAALGIADLRGFDSGPYVVRVSNPTGDRLSHPAYVKVSFDPAPLVGIPHTPEAAFTNVPPPANTRRDVWQFFHSIQETNRTGRYARMDLFANPWQAAGLAAWTFASSPSQAAGFNPSSAPVIALGASVPPGRVFLHPGGNVSNCVSLAWQAEVAGLYTVTGRLSRLAVDASGDGVRWHLDIGSVNVASGVIANTGTETNVSLAGVYLNRGERLHLIVSPGESELGDLTGVELEVSLTEPDPNSEPGFLESPQNVAVLAGQNAAFNANVDGSPEPVLQWQRSTNNGATWEALVDGEGFAGVNTTNLEVFGVTLEMNGQLFRVEAINAAGFAVSGVARLTVTEGPAAPSFVMQPQGAIALSGGLVILGAEASGTGPLSYQWYRNGEAMNGQTAATLTIQAAAPSDSGTYHVVVSSPLGSQASSAVTVTVDDPPPPPVLGLGVVSNEVAILLKGRPGSPWQIWRSDEVSGPWQPLAQVTAPPELDEAVVALDTAPPPKSAFYLAELDLPPTLPVITAPPLSTTFTEGGEGVLNLVTAGAGPLAFQWWKDGALLAGETNQMLTMPGITTNRAGNYFVVVSNAYGVVTSAVAMVSVAPPPLIVKLGNIVATATSELSQLGRLAAATLNGIKFDGNFWESAGPNFGEDRDPAITFDLQGVCRLDQVVIWNAHELDPALKRMRVEYSIDGVNFEVFGELDLAPGTASDEPSGYYALDQIKARFIRFDILENHSGQVFPFTGTATAYPLVALSEVEFYGELLSLAAPEITAQPVSFTNCLAGISISLSATAKGPPPLSFQWWQEEFPLAGATNALLGLGPLTAAHAGRYSLFVSNSAGETVSAPALVTVVTNPPLVAVPTNGLLAYLPLNNSTADVSGNDRNALNINAQITRDRFGVLGAAFALANDAYLTVPGLDPDDFSTGFSFGCWFRAGAPNAQRLFYWNPDGAGGLIRLAVGPGLLDLRLGVAEHSVTGLSMPQDQWHHVMVTHGADLDRLYFNGVQVGEWPAFPLQGNAVPLFMGLGFLQGALDDVTIFGRELGSSEVQALAVP